MTNELRIESNQTTAYSSMEIEDPIHADGPTSSLQGRVGILGAVRPANMYLALTYLFMAVVTAGVSVYNTMKSKDPVRASDILPTSSIFNLLVSGFFFFLVHKANKEADFFLLDAAKMSHPSALEYVKNALNEGAAINARDYLGRTSLHCAVSQQNKELVHFLLKHGAKVNIEDNSGRTPLSEAIRIGDANLVKLLLKYDVEIDAETLFSYAVKMMSSLKIKHLIDICENIGRLSSISRKKNPHWYLYNLRWTQ